MIYWNVSVSLLAAVTTGGTVLLPCGITYEEYREDLLGYGYTPIECKDTERYYKSSEIKWNELCKSTVGGSLYTHSQYPIARWRQPVSGHTFKIPVNLSLKKGLCVPPAVYLIKSESLNRKNYKEIPTGVYGYGEDGKIGMYSWRIYQ